MEQWHTSNSVITLVREASICSHSSTSVYCRKKFTQICFYQVVAPKPQAATCRLIATYQNSPAYEYGLCGQDWHNTEAMDRNNEMWYKISIAIAGKTAHASLQIHIAVRRQHKKTAITVNNWFTDHNAQVLNQMKRCCVNKWWDLGPDYEPVINQINMHGADVILGWLLRYNRTVPNTTGFTDQSTYKR